MEIHKFFIPMSDSCRISMPKGSEILSFQCQSNNLVLWALVDPDVECEERYFSVYGTGYQVDVDKIKKYIGTTQMYEGTLVWHLFEMKEEIK